MGTVDRDWRRDRLYDLLVANLDGIVVEDIMEVFEDEYPGRTESRYYRMARDAIHELRLFLGEDDSINLVCDPQGQGERWLYRLVGTVPESLPWTANRVEDMDARLFTVESVCRSMVLATNGRTREGRKVRVRERALRRLREDLADIDLDGGP